MIISELKLILKTALQDIQSLTRASEVEVLDPKEASQQSFVKALAGISGELEVIVPIEGLVDLEALRSRLNKDLARAEQEIAILAGRLNNPNFSQKAPLDVVSECRAKLEEAEVQAQLARKRLGDLN